MFRRYDSRCCLSSGMNQAERKTWMCCLRDTKTPQRSCDIYPNDGCLTANTYGYFIGLGKYGHGATSWKHSQWHKPQDRKGVRGEEAGPPSHTQHRLNHTKKFRLATQALRLGGTGRRLRCRETTTTLVVVDPLRRSTCLWRVPCSQTWHPQVYPAPLPTSYFPPYLLRCLRCSCPTPRTTRTRCG